MLWVRPERFCECVVLLPARGSEKFQEEKAQIIKNAIIIPVGAKGGFICKETSFVSDGILRGPIVRRPRC